MPVYKVSTPTGTRYVEAKTPASAKNHTISDAEYSVELLNSTEIVQLARAGVTIEDAMPAVKAA